MAALASASLRVVGALVRRSVGMGSRGDIDLLDSSYGTLATRLEVRTYYSAHYVLYYVVHIYDAVRSQFSSILLI